MTTLAPEALAARVRAAFPYIKERRSDNGQPFLLVPAVALLAVCRFARDETDLAFDSLMDLTGYDLLRFPGEPASDAIAVVYLLHSMRHRHKLTLKVHAPRADCVVPTVGAIWPAAIYFEREVWDLLGVRFAEHPSLLRIMCPDDWIGHALRKDYVYPDDYHGVPHLREGQRFEGGPQRTVAEADAKGVESKQAQAKAAESKAAEVKAASTKAAATKSAAPASEKPASAKAASEKPSAKPASSSTPDPAKDGGA
jgi:NADH-quinone oxidoreductase subunit C